MRIEDLKFQDVEYGNTTLLVGDNKDPYKVKPVYMETYGACALTIPQTEDLIAKLMEIVAKYEKEN